MEKSCTVIGVILCPEIFWWRDLNGDHSGFCRQKKIDFQLYKKAKLRMPIKVKNEKQKTKGETDRKKRTGQISMN